MLMVSCITYVVPLVGPQYRSLYLKEVETACHVTLQFLVAVVVNKSRIRLIDEYSYYETLLLQYFIRVSPLHGHVFLTNEVKWSHWIYTRFEITVT